MGNEDCYFKWLTKLLNKSTILGKVPKRKPVRASAQRKSWRETPYLVWVVLNTNRQVVSWAFECKWFFQNRDVTCARVRGEGGVLEVATCKAHHSVGIAVS